MSLWIKICGNTSLADAQLAAEAGADAVGFVFAPSPRRVTPDQVAAITRHLPDAVEKIGVFVDAGLPAIAATVEQAGLTGVQIHLTGESELAAQLRLRFGPRLRILQVVHFGENAVGQLAAAAENPDIDGILVDSRTAAAAGGTGIAYDWKAARDTIFTHSNRQKLIAAGGLNPGNVAEAIAALNPWGVDVVTGVESAPGRKDPAKVCEFVLKARARARARSVLSPQLKLSTP
jgi:phosphoribosylanthranilate isomerase